jgi:rubrerythrin
MAEQAGDKASLLHFSQSRDVEETHAKLYKQAMNHFMEERETVYHVCKVCGYVADGVLPDECPVCAAKKDQFTTFDS